MKRMLSRTVMLGFSGLLAGGMLFGQDLAQLAKKTRQQSLKTKQQQSVRVWNNDNIPKAPARGGPTAAAGMSPLRTNASALTVIFDNDEPVFTVFANNDVSALTIYADPDVFALSYRHRKLP